MTEEQETINPTSEATAPAIEIPAEPLISIEDFLKVKLRVAKVLHAEAVPKSKKLLKLDVEISGEKRQILSGIAQFYEPQNLIGKHVVVVANLQPAKLMGLDSCGMILAVITDDNSKLSVMEVSDTFPSGSIVR